MRRILPPILLVAASLVTVRPAPAREPAPEPVDFARDIRPIFESVCLKCHGPVKPKGDFRLDSRAAALEDGEAILPGKSGESLLVQLLLTDDRKERMPQKAKPLQKEQIDLIRRWIDEGAVWPDDGSAAPRPVHWSLRPLSAPAVPQVRNVAWVRTPIDAFILAKLEENDLTPAPPADRRTLLRRVTFDLTGLPPTPEETAAFLADPSPRAYEDVLDRLLAGPRYAERWARHWLDVVHYADSHGHDQDRPRPNAWPYRDWVIRALHEDMPWARFVEDQVAGDVLRPEDPQALVATGFLAAGPWDESSQMAIMADTIDKKIAQNLDRDDMLMTTASSFFSTTIHCARCHNHKFDPVTQVEYYRMQSFFAGVDRADRPFDDNPVIHLRRQALLRRKTLLDARRASMTDELLAPPLQAEVAAWEDAGAGRSEKWTVLAPRSAASKNGCTLTAQADGSVLSSGERPETDTYTIVVETDLTGITAVRLEVLTDDTHPYRGPGRQDNGNLHLSEFSVRAAPRAGGGGETPVVLQNPTADFNQQDWNVAHAIDGKMETAWGVYPEIGKPHEAVFECKDAVGFPGGTRLTFVLEQNHGRRHLIARPRLSVTTAPRPVTVVTHPDKVLKILATPREARTDGDRAELAARWLEMKIDRDIAALPPPRWVYAGASDFAPKANFSPARTPRPVQVLRRGDVAQPLEPVLPGGLACVPGLDPAVALADPEDEGARRAALAKWITDPRNVLTWRSAVNRVWHYHFGRGIVDTPNDFGVMGGTPSHPELLDWLAVRFRDDDGGSLKRLHRRILTSAVYLQSSRHDPEAAKVDADNRLLWRMNRLRLDAESIRDGILQMTGRIDLAMGGPPVMQFRYEDPNPGRTPVIDYEKFDVDAPASRRRSVYRHVFRTVPDPFLDCLDCADASQLTPVRNTSFTALQAMAMYNDRFVVRHAEHLAERAAAAGDAGAQIDAVFALALNRPPRPEEKAKFAAYAAKHGMTNLCRVILNSSEFLFVD